MNISYVTTYNANDIHNWSGLGYMIAKALEGQNNHIDYIGNLTSSPNIEMYLRKLYFKVLGKDFDFGREIHTAQQYARQISPRIKANTDVIFSPGTIPVSLLETNKPKVFYTDATLAGMIGFYKYLSNLSSVSIKHGNFLEQSALDSCQLAIYSSDWAANTAIKHYGTNPEKVKVVPFGSNLDSEKSIDDIKLLISQKSRQECHLLFLAVDWERKGGDLALQITRSLNEQGVKTILHIVGIKELPFDKIHPFVRTHGFVSKASKEGKDLMNELIEKSHFLILPTRADCTPVVFSEANSFGLPCITTEVGGIPTIIRDGINGRAFSLNAAPESYAEYIESIFSDWNLYADLALSSFNEYESRLNWNVAGKTITRLMADL
ncbi:glycosyltransferase family 4 protein [Dyadobacter luticola]|uniref:Glycosyltransferase family 4 protein n=1 Tax=Dyadobacter luticola TaxID=1979387 RepID=A0A5R9KXB2_9BACT|nr:glycosyltransferase family 4 protein [Dyadobacter luticola]TLV00780.1 glycosyltransferase family 4 protein [Dyadobacter luticola]